MKYIFIDTDNGGTPSNATPDTSTSIYHTSSSWPANGARWSTLSGALGNATVRGITDDLTIYCQGATDETTTGFGFSSMTCASLLIQGDFAAAAPDTNAYLAKVTGTAQNLLTHNKAITLTLRGLQLSHLGTSTVQNYIAECNTASATLIIDSCYLILNGSSTSAATAVLCSTSASAAVTMYNTVIDVKSSLGSTTRGFSRTNGTITAYNCVIHGPGSVGTGVFSASGGTIKNCAVFDWLDDFSGTTISYCASDDGDGTNAQSGATWSSEFEGYTSGDFRIKVGSTKLKDLGVGDPGAGLFSDDIVGTSRPQGTAWDIGAFEYVSVGGPRRIRPATIIKAQAATISGTGSVA